MYCRIIPYIILFRVVFQIVKNVGSQSWPLYLNDCTAAPQSVTA